MMGIAIAPAAAGRAAGSTHPTNFAIRDFSQ
jgi:hypothetical protein